MFQWLNEEDLVSLSMAPGETRLQKLKFVLAFFAATVMAKRARDENEKTAAAVEFSKSKEPETDPKSYASGEWVSVDPASVGLNSAP